MTRQLSPTASASSTTPRHRKFRSDIQGLRALAVLVVVADHLFHWPTGGFVGVDIFFVLSGFLITGILLREVEETGRIRLIRFYLRRFKRLVPAALLVIATSVVLGRAIFYSEGASAVLQDGVWALFFIANWRFVRSGTDYFAMDGPTSPLQHYWSLSVEEQFYVVWPLLLLLASVVSALLLRAKTRLRPVAAMIVGAVTLASFVWAVMQSEAEPVVAYFSTFTRAWELGAGALLAIVAPKLVALSERVRSALAYGGLVIMVGAFLVLTPDVPFPGPWAAAPVAGALLLIASGIGRQAPHLALLTNPVSTYIGNISYSLYLWHFPVIVFGSIAFSGLGVWAPLAVLAVSFGTASVTHHLVEQPIHRSPLFNRLPRGEFVGAWSNWARRWRPSVVHAVVGGVVVASVTFGLFAYTQGRDPSSSPADVSASASIPELLASAVGRTTLPADVSQQIDSAASDTPATYWPDSGCHNPASVTDTDRCRFGSGSLHALVIGDSVAAATLPPITEALDAIGYRTTGIAFSSCAVSSARLSWPSAPAREQDCATFQDDLANMVARESPDLVIVLDSEIAYEGIDTRGLARQHAWEVGRREALTTLKESVPQVLLMHPNPRGTSLGECANRVTNSATACVSPVSQSWHDKAGIDERVAAELGIPIVQTLDLFCTDDRCPIYASDVVQRFDKGHLTGAYLGLIAPELRTRLANAVEPSM
ncbi:acyltransferase family protein [Pseudoclavibacter helvolus]|uniref:acyltransferase family protein n=1 Tax=Pseudoclavibacter helvolus TaxID=255205 RepID=UPI000837ADE5|nr:acyltransferase family protein [Pseudoclavibacter helvolus]